MSRWIFVQARLGSQRLPQKVLQNIGSKHAIGHLSERLEYLRTLLPNLNIAYLIPDNADNQKLKDTINSLPNCHIYRGSEENVLSRFADAAKKFKPSKILRLTADCPFVDPFSLMRLIEIGDKNNLDYCYLAQSYAEGICGDYFTSNALQKAASVVNKRPEDIEHITPYFHRNKHVLNVSGVDNYRDDSAFRIVLDSKNDFIALTELEKHLTKINAPNKYKFNTVRRIIEQHPDIFSINNGEARNEKFDVFSIEQQL